MKLNFYSSSPSNRTERAPKKPVFGAFCDNYSANHSCFSWIETSLECRPCSIRSVCASVSSISCSGYSLTYSWSVGGRMSSNPATRSAHVPETVADRPGGGESGYGSVVFMYCTLKYQPAFSLPTRQDSSLPRATYLLLFQNSCRLV